MRVLEQLKVIVEKEIKTKQWLKDHDANTKITQNYWAGGLAALSYIKHVIDKLIKEEDGE
jgi:hypothetical protein